MPSSVTVVRLFTRLAPVPGGPTPDEGVQRDYLWIYKDELRAIRDAAVQRRPFLLPPSLATRLARFHLIDNVRGEPDMWRPGEVRKAGFRVTRVEAAGPIYTLIWSGRYDLRRQDGRRSLEGAVDGRMVIDSRTLRLTRFQAYAEGNATRVTKSGVTRKFRLLIAMVDTKDPVARIVPPEAVSLGYGKEYRPGAAYTAHD